MKAERIAEGKYKDTQKWRSRAAQSANRMASRPLPSLDMVTHINYNGGKQVDELLKTLSELARQHCSIRQLVRLTGMSKAVIERMLRNERRMNRPRV